MSKKSRAEKLIGKCFLEHGFPNKIIGLTNCQGKLGFLLEPRNRTISVPSRMRFDFIFISETEYQNHNTWNQVKDLLTWLHDFVLMDSSNIFEEKHVKHLQNLWDKGPGFYREAIQNVSMDSRPVNLYAKLLFLEQLREKKLI